MTDKPTSEELRNVSRVEVRRVIDGDGKPVFQATIQLKGRTDEEIQADIDAVLSAVNAPKKGATP